LLPLPAMHYSTSPARSLCRSMTRIVGMQPPYFPADSNVCPT